MYNSKQLESNNPCTLVIDSGFSFTHVVPYFNDLKINYAIKRINIGGKLLTNYLKEVASYRQWNMLEETYLMNVIKERCCYTSLDYLRDLDITKMKGNLNTIQCEYVLPDYATNQTGYIKPKEPQTTPMQVEGEVKKVEEQILKMNNERIAVPELLFNPSDIGVNQAGIAETIVQSVESVHPDLHAALYNNIIVTGGNTKFANFKERLTFELRKLVPEEYEVNFTFPEDPISYAWQGGCKFAVNPNWHRYVVTKAEYLEKGHDLCLRKFFN